MIHVFVCEVGYGCVLNREDGGRGEVEGEGVEERLELVGGCGGKGVARWALNAKDGFAVSGGRASWFIFLIVTGAGVPMGWFGFVDAGEVVLGVAAFFNDEFGFVLELGVIIK